VGTDGRLVRESISELVSWLDAEHVGRTDGAGRTVARFGVVPEVYQAYLDWEAAHPEELQAHAAAINARTHFRRLPGIHAALEATYHEEALSLGVAGVVAHRFVAAGSGTSYVLLYSDTGAAEVSAGGYLPEERDVMAGDGTVTSAGGATIAVGETPVLVGPRGGFPTVGAPDGGVPDGGGGTCASGCPTDWVCCPTGFGCAGQCVPDCRVGTVPCPTQAPTCDTTIGVCS